MTNEEIFTQVIARMIKGLMVHDQLATYYDFLGLEGYKRCHEYHFLEESKVYRKMCHFYMKEYDLLLPETKFDNPNIIPNAWYGYTRQEVDIKTKQTAVQKGLNEWVRWEDGTSSLYQKLYKELIANGEVAAAAKLADIICHVKEELYTAKQYQLNKISTNYDMTDIIQEQKFYHDKYKKMIKEV